jgi:hypothetical protein
MKKIEIIRLGTLLLGVIFLIGTFTGCDDKKNSSRYFNRYGAGQYGTNSPTYSNQGLNNSGYPGGGFTPGGLGGLGGLGGGGGVYMPGQTAGLPGTGMPGQVYRYPQIKQGAPSNEFFPYVVNKQISPWSEDCDNRDKLPENSTWMAKNGDKFIADGNSEVRLEYYLKDADNDGICNGYEIEHAKAKEGSLALHPNSYNGFKVAGVTFSKDDPKLAEAQDADSFGVLREAFNNSSARIASDGSGDTNVGIVEGGWDKQVSNWGTVVKEQYRKGKNLPTQEAVLANPSQIIAKKKELKISQIPGFNDGSESMQRDHYILCAEAWFKKPGGSDSTSFRIFNADKYADDGVYLFDNGMLKAYSFRDNPEGFFNVIGRSIIGYRGDNELEYSIVDNKFHLMAFCFVNEKKDKGQGEIRYWRDTKSENMGYEPLSPLDFRVTRPEGYDKQADKELIKFDKADKGESDFQVKPADDSQIGKDIPPFVGVTGTVAPTAGEQVKGSDRSTIGKDIIDKKQQYSQLWNEDWQKLSDKLIALLNERKTMVDERKTVLGSDGLPDADVDYNIYIQLIEKGKSLPNLTDEQKINLLGEFNLAKDDMKTSGVPLDIFNEFMKIYSKLQGSVTDLAKKQGAVSQGTNNAITTIGK